MLEITNSELLGWKLVACFVVSSYRLKNSVAYTRIWQRFHVRKEQEFQYSNFSSNFNKILFEPLVNVGFFVNVMNCTCVTIVFVYMYARI